MTPSRFLSPEAQALNAAAQKAWDEAGAGDDFHGRQFAIAMGTGELDAARAAWAQKGPALAKWRAKGDEKKLPAVGRFSSALEAAVYQGLAEWSRALLACTPNALLSGDELLTAAMEGALARAKNAPSSGVSAAEVARALLARGASLKSGPEKKDLLMLAVKSGRADLAEIALETCNPNARVKSRKAYESALDYAVDAVCDQRGNGAFEAIWARVETNGLDQGTVDSALRRAVENLEIANEAAMTQMRGMIGKIASRASDAALEDAIARGQKRKRSVEPLLAETEARALRLEMAELGERQAQGQKKAPSRRL